MLRKFTESDCHTRVTELYSLTYLSLDSESNDILTFFINGLGEKLGLGDQKWFWSGVGNVRTRGFEN